MATTPDIHDTHKTEGVSDAVVVTLIMPYFENPVMLGVHLRTWARYSAVCKRAIEMVIVDDGSPDHPAKTVVMDAVRGATELVLPRVRIFRVIPNIPWNQDGARNLAFHHATPGRTCLVTDMDHVLEPSAAEALVTAAASKPGLLHPRAVYEIPRHKTTSGGTAEEDEGKGRLKCLKPHCNSFIVNRDLYWEAGGYNEAFVGLYAVAGDIEFRGRLASASDTGRIFPAPQGVYLTVYGRGDVCDADTATLSRTPVDERVKQKAHTQPHRVLQFDWEECTFDSSNPRA